MTDLEPRDNFGANADTPSDLVWEVREHTVRAAAPRATIAIPTYKRFDTLLEAITSASAQAGPDRPDIIIVDNEGHGDKPAAVRAALPNLDGCSVRYFVNRSNLGMFGNWNRCIELAQTPWLTILNDDDLLRPTFLERSFQALDRFPQADGIVCKKGIFDRRTVRSASPPRLLLDRIVNALRLLLHKASFQKGVLTVDPRRLFFGNVLGNGAGFLFRRDAALNLGGYDAEEWPSADFLFYVRMALGGRLLWLDEKLAYVGLGDNESMAPEVLRRFVTQLHEVRIQMIGTIVPSDWQRMLPLIAANHILATELAWGVRLDAADIGRELDMTLSSPNFSAEQFQQLRHGFL